MANYRLEDLEVYQMALAFADKVWNIVVTWDKFNRYHPGTQFTEAADSIPANIAEGYGRFHYREKLNFNYYARGSIFETKDWIVKSANRGLIGPEQQVELLSDLRGIFEKLNGYNKHIRRNL